MSNTDNDDVLVQDELATLKARADLLGLSYHPSIGVEKLRVKVNAAASGQNTTYADESEAEPASKVTNKAAAKEPTVESKNERHIRLKKEANELIRVRVTCMNPAKTAWEGEIFTVGNSSVGTIKKYVPFNVDEGWHVPRIILDQLKERQCQIFVAVRDERGNSVHKGKLIKEFSIEVLPQLTLAELEELARKQALSNAID